MFRKASEWLEVPRSGAVEPMSYSAGALTICIAHAIRARADLHDPHLTDKASIHVRSRVEHEPVLRLLKLVHAEHDDDASKQRSQCRVKCDAKTKRYTCDIAANGGLRLLKGRADAAHSSDESDGGNC